MQKVPTYLSENACNVKSGDYLSVDIPPLARACSSCLL